MGYDIQGQRRHRLCCWQVWGRKEADKYLLDQVRDRMDFPATLTAVKSLTAKWPQATR